MTLLAGRRGRAARGIDERLDALAQVLELAPGRVPEELVARARRVAERAGARLRLGADHTVVALAGATGSGKSSLFNALAGEPVSQVGLRRPTTGATHAALWPVPGPDGEQEAAPDPVGPGALLDWLAVPRRHHPAAAEGAGGLAGLVLLDLPDTDSVRREHRREADRLVERADLIVWVVDPQKYADAALHERYLTRFAGHGAVMVVALNQVDRLSPAARRGCLADLSRLLGERGLGQVPVLAVSAVSGEGIGELRDLLAQRVGARRAALQRLDADLSDLAGGLARELTGTAVDAGTPVDAGTAAPPTARRSLGRSERDQLVLALADAAGTEVVVDAVQRAHRLRAARATGWPITRWTGRLRRDPARRLRLRDEPSELVRTSLAGPSAVQRARVDSAVRALSDTAAAGLPAPWPTLVRRAAGQARAQLPDLLDRAVAGTDLGLGRQRGWWRAANALQWVLLLVATAGGGWLAVLAGLAWLRLPDPGAPNWGPLPAPTVLLLGGLLAGALLAVVGRVPAGLGARRAGRRARRLLLARIGALADDVVIAPVERELAVRAELTATVARLRA